MKRPRGKIHRRDLGKPKIVAHHRQRLWFFLGSVFVVLAGLLVAGFIIRVNTGRLPHLSQADAQAGEKGNPLKPPQTMVELLALKPSELEGMDVGLMNLLCAGGLKGSEKLDLVASLKTLDLMAETVRFETSRNSYRFAEHPAEYYNSPGYFRMLYLFTVLQRDGGLHYNPDRITPIGVFEPNDVFFADSRDIFIHGLLDPDRRSGTCASLPVIYVAVGRRLGYPLKLVPTKNHLFIRWEDEHERFNIDGTSVGLNVYDDQKYKEWPFPVSDDEIKEFGYLKSMTPARELSAFLAMRGHCLLAMGRLQEGLAAHEAALRFAPENREQQLILADVKEEVAYRSASLDLLPPEQLQRGAIPVDINSPQADAARGAWLAEQLSRQKRGELPATASGPQGVPGYVPTVIPDPNPLKQIQNQFNKP
jgi:Transglutaminase-like superfamily